MTWPLHGCMRLQNGPATSKAMILLAKFLTVARLQRFRRVPVGNFNLPVGSGLKLSGHHLRKTVQPCNGQRFPAKYQYLAGCTRGLQPRATTASRELGSC
jgi:hypothetical protein